MTRTDAKRILQEAGESSSPGALSGIRARTGDPVILKACDRLSEDLLAIARRRQAPGMWVKLTSLGPVVRVGHAQGRGL